MAIAPIAGPLLGGQILKLSTWHDIFWLLAVIGSLMFISLFFLPETHTNNRRQKNSVKVVFQHYGRLLNHWPFIRYILSVTFFYGNIVGIMALSFINRTLVSHFSLDSLLRCAITFSAMALVILCALFYLGIGGIYSIVIMVFFFFSMNGTVAANSTAAALDGVPEIAGSASALIGSLQYTIWQWNNFFTITCMALYWYACNHDCDYDVFYCVECCYDSYSIQKKRK